MREDPGPEEHFDSGGLGELAEHPGDVGFHIQTAAGRFLLPLLGIAVSVKAHHVDDRADDGLQYIHNGDGRVLSLCQLLVYVGLEANQLVGHSCIERCHRTGTVGAGAHGTEFKAVAGECKRGSPVPVGVVHEDFRNLHQAHALSFFPGNFDGRIGGHLQKFAEHLGHRLPQESRHDGRRSFVGAQAMRVGGTGNGSLQQGIVLLDGSQYIHEEGDELEIPPGILARCQQLDTGVRSQRPVVVLSGTVHPLEGFFVQKHHKIVLARNFGHQVHHKLVLVVGQIGFSIDGSQFELVGGHLVVTCLQGDAQPVAGNLQVAHKGGHPGGNGAEVVIVQLLVLGGIVAEERPARDHQVGPGSVQGFVNQEILLLPAQVGIDLGNGRIEEPAHGHCGIVHGLQSLFERGLVVQGFSGVGDEHGGYTKRIVQDEDRRGGVPGRIPAGFEGGTETAAGERGSVRLLLGQHRTVEGFDHASLPVIVDEGIVLFGRPFREGLKPVGDVRNPVFQGPHLHSTGHRIGRFPVQGFSSLDTGEQRAESVFIQVTGHFQAVEHPFSEVFGRFPRRGFGRNFLALEGFLHQIEPVHTITPTRWCRWAWG